MIGKYACSGSSKLLIFFFLRILRHWYFQGWTMIIWGIFILFSYSKYGKTCHKPCWCRNVKSCKIVFQVFPSSAFLLSVFFFNMVSLAQYTIIMFGLCHSDTIQHIYIKVNWFFNELKEKKERDRDMYIFSNFYKFSWHFLSIFKHVTLIVINNQDAIAWDLAAIPVNQMSHFIKIFLVNQELILLTEIL